MHCGKTEFLLWFLVPLPGNLPRNAWSCSSPYWRVRYKLQFCSCFIYMDFAGRELPVKWTTCENDNGSCKCNTPWKCHWYLNLQKYLSKNKNTLMQNTFLTVIFVLFCKSQINNKSFLLLILKTFWLSLSNFVN